MPIFWKLYALIAARHGEEPDYRATATLTGIFFGDDIRNSKGDVLLFGGYGHLGCCALLLITQVSDVESVPPANLDVHGVVIGSDGQPVEGLTVVDDVLGGSLPAAGQQLRTRKESSPSPIRDGSFGSKALIIARWHSR